MGPVWHMPCVALVKYPGAVPLRHWNKLARDTELTNRAWENVYHKAEKNRRNVLPKVLVTGRNKVNIRAIEKNINLITYNLFLCILVWAEKVDGLHVAEVDVMAEQKYKQ